MDDRLNLMYFVYRAFISVKNIINIGRQVGIHIFVFGKKNYEKQSVYLRALLLLE
jgi:hypothetical protein